MKHFLLVAPCLLFASIAPADTKPPPPLVAQRCAERSLGSAADCACLQTLANGTIRIGLHDLIAQYLGRQIDVAAIAAERGHSGAEQLASEAYVFRREAQKTCGIDLPEG
jgi:hypothetical protein